MNVYSTILDEHILLCMARRFLCCCVIILAIPSAWAGSCSQQERKGIDLSSKPLFESSEIISNLYFLEENVISPQPLRDRPPRWNKFEAQHIDFGFTRSKIWLCLPVTNASDKPIKRILNLNSRFMNLIEVDLVGNTSVRVIAESDVTKFSNRSIPHRYLATEIELGAQEQAQVVIRYYSLGSTTLPITIHSEQHYYQSWIRKNVAIIAFYSVIAFMMAFSFFQFLILKTPVQLAYIGYVGSASLYIFHMDGLSFKFLWPTWPELNAVASTYLGLSINFFSIFFARIFLNTKKTNPKMDFIFLCMLFITAAIVVFEMVSDSGLVKKLAFVQTTSVLFLCAVAGFIAYFKGQRSARYYIIGWVGITFCAALATASNLISAVISIPFTFDLSKLGVFFDSLMFAMAMADQTSEIRDERDAITKQKTELLQKELETQRQLLSLENEYKSVLSLAQEKSHLLASAGHDLRQPVVALRAAMQTVIDRDQGDQQSLEQFQQGFNYIEQLIKQYLSVPDELREAGVATNIQEQLVEQPSDQSRKETFSLNIILNNIRVMFEKDAKRKKLYFSVQSSSVRVSADPLVVMRMLGNLVENAIKYTESGKVLLGCRRMTGCVKIMVLDTGPGISGPNKKKIFATYERGSAYDSKHSGLGLGLSIVTELAREAAIPFTLDSSSVRGSVFSLTLPVCEGPKSER